MLVYYVVLLVISGTGFAPNAYGDQAQGVYLPPKPKFSKCPPKPKSHPVKPQSRNWKNQVWAVIIPNSGQMSKPWKNWTNYGQTGQTGQIPNSK
jgi:hypothetical protein